MKVIAIVIIVLGMLVFIIGLRGSQHEVMAMLSGNGSNVQPSGKSINPSGPSGS